MAENKNNQTNEMREFYKEKIKEIIDDIESVDVLMYLLEYVKGKVG